MPVKLNPLVPLAVNLADCRRRFVLFVGSGVSKDAGVPTGWDILIDTLGKIYSQEHKGQKLSYQEIEAWYKGEKSLRKLGYSEILDFMCKGQEQKRQYLLDYFKDKEPGNVHYQIAKMVSMGLIRFIITTNFDTLLERALDAEGFHDKYSVISTEDQIKHSDTWDKVEICRIYKIHGSIKEGQIRNSLKELESLGPLIGKEFQELIDRHGIIVVGYSGADKGVMSHFQKREYHRYPIYWQYRNNVRELVSEIITRQDGELIRFDRASQFFGDLIRRVELIQKESTLEGSTESVKDYYVRILQGGNNIQIVNEIENEQNFFLKNLEETLEKVTKNWEDLWNANVKLIKELRNNMILSDQIIRFDLHQYWNQYAQLLGRIYDFNRSFERYGKDGLVNNLFYQLFLYTGASLFQLLNFRLLRDLFSLKKIIHNTLLEIHQWNIQASFVQQKNEAEDKRFYCPRFEYLRQLVESSEFPDSSKKRIDNIIQFDFICYMYTLRYPRANIFHQWFPCAMYYADHSLEFITRLVLDPSFLKKMGNELFDLGEIDFRSFLTKIPGTYGQLLSQVPAFIDNHFIELNNLKDKESK